MCLSQLLAAAENTLLFVYISKTKEVLDLVMIQLLELKVIVSPIPSLRCPVNRHAVYFLTLKADLPTQCIYKNIQNIMTELRGAVILLLH